MINKRSRSLTEKSTLFYDPQNVDCRRAARLLHKGLYKFDLLDISANGVSSYLFEDMRISKLPALYVVSAGTYKVYEGLDQIETLLEAKR